MAYDKRIICLANSRKTSGRCVAGKEIKSGAVQGWVRPVSVRSTGEVSEEERRYKDGTDPKLLDVIDIRMSVAKPHGFQTENHVIDPEQDWTFVRKASAAELAAAVDTVKGPLWDNQSCSYNGEFDRVEEAAAIKHGNSLKLIKVNDLRINVGVEGAEFNNAKRKVRGSFSLNGAKYLLSVTDPLIERQYLRGGDGQFSVGPATLCISLGEPYQGYAYKLIAGVILP